MTQEKPKVVLGTGAYGDLERPWLNRKQLDEEGWTPTKEKGVVEGETGAASAPVEDAPKDYEQ